jgi:histidinol-phosphate/aromatic aminotransferase/cobyric acid decarboxylase-like protein
MIDFLEKLSFMDNILLDESFIEFTGIPELVEEKFYNYKNITIIRLMSKVFGFTVLKAGYCKQVMLNNY